MIYTTGHVTNLFNMSRTTLATWCKEFAAYLSPTANPPQGGHRRFSDDDLSVFQLVHSQKKAGLTFEEVHASLANGERGERIDTLDIQPQTPVSGAIIALQHHIQALEHQLREAERRADGAEAVANELRRQLEKERSDVLHLSIELAKLQEKQ